MTNQLKKYGDKIDPVFGKADVALQSNIVNQIAKYVDKHGPIIAEQALMQVRHNSSAQAPLHGHDNWSDPQNWASAELQTF